MFACCGMDKVVKVKASREQWLRLGKCRSTVKFRLARFIQAVVAFLSFSWQVKFYLMRDHLAFVFCFCFWNINMYLFSLLLLDNFRINAGDKHYWNTLGRLLSGRRASMDLILVIIVSRLAPSHEQMSMCFSFYRGIYTSSCIWFNYCYYKYKFIISLCN